MDLTAGPPSLTGDERMLRALAGQALYGDDFSAGEIERWFADEREGYYNLYYRDAPKDTASSTQYAYQALAERHGFRWLPEQQFAHALGIGSADGAELRAILQRSQRVTVLEPADGFAATEVGGKPVDYVKPLASGLMPFAGATFDLVICFSVLHHIPNVSTVIREIQRVLRPAGHVLLREPTHSMGDWRRPRRGLTPHERGIPLPLFRDIIAQSGLRVLRETLCNFSLTPRLEPLLGRPVWTIPWVVALDAWICAQPIWTRRYHATRLWHKLRPTGVAYVLDKPVR